MKTACKTVKPFKQVANAYLRWFQAINTIGADRFVYILRNVFKFWLFLKKIKEMTVKKSGIFIVLTNFDRILSNLVLILHFWRYVMISIFGTFFFCRATLSWVSDCMSCVTDFLSPYTELRARKTKACAMYLLKNGHLQWSDLFNLGQFKD